MQTQRPRAVAAAPPRFADLRVDYHSPLGSGAVGAVFAAYYEQGQCELAVKVMSPSMMTKAAFSHEEIKEAIEQERHSMEALGFGSSHPHVVNVVGCFEMPAWEALQRGLQSKVDSLDEPVTYVVMERLKGDSLEDRIQAAGGFSEERAKQVTRAICQGLGFLHQRGIAHRDICPRNVLYAEAESPDEDCKIIDFSHAGVLPSDAAPDAKCFDKRLGTAGFVAPEVLAEGVSYGTKCDIYSLGCTLHSMICNRKLPRRHPRIGIMTSLPASLSPGAKDFIASTLLQDPEQRPTVAQLLQSPWLA